MTEDERTLVINTAFALRGEVTPDLIAVSAAMAGDRITLKFMFDGPPSEDDIERCQCIGTVVVSHYLTARITEEIVHAAEPLQNLQPGDILVYQRAPRARGLTPSISAIS